jgi:hypothetical protein
VVVFVGFCVQQAPDYARQIGDNPVVRNTLFVIITVLVLLVVLIRTGARRWGHVAGDRRAAS